MVKKMNTFVDTLEDTEIQDELSPKQRACWEAFIKRDLQEMAEGKPQKYISGDEFWGKITEAVMQYAAL